MNNGINKKQLIIAGIVFVVAFLVSREIFSNWDAIKAFLFGN